MNWHSASRWDSWASRLGLRSFGCSSLNASQSGSSLFCLCVSMRVGASKSWLDPRKTGSSSFQVKVVPRPQSLRRLRLRLSPQWPALSRTPLRPRISASTPGTRQVPVKSTFRSASPHEFGIEKSEGHLNPFTGQLGSLVERETFGHAGRA